MPTQTDKTTPGRTVGRTTYYNSFPKQPREGSILVAVLWVIDNDYRSIATSEKRNVVYPAKRAGLVDIAPANELGVKLNRKGETSRCGFILTELGKKYYNDHIKPVIPEGFGSSIPAVPTRHVGQNNLPTEELATKG